MGVIEKAKKIAADAIGGNGKLEAFKIENDEHVIEAKRAEAEAVKRAHELENGLAQLVSDRTGADNAYTAAAGLPDEAGVREGRRKFIAADEAVRARQDHIRRSQIAATEARKRREQVEQEAERRIAAKIREAVAANIAKTRALVEGPEGMRALAEQREELAHAAESLSPWGSAAATRIGRFASMGESGREVCSGRGVPGLGPTAVQACFLPDPYAQGGCSWDRWLESAKHAGIITE